MADEYLDVVVVGAGISGICAGYHLLNDCPDKTFAILEARDVIGGTWDLFRYPGIRSDSDMFTLGFPFRPWTDSKSIADGGDILRYVQDTAAEFGIDQKIRYRHKVTGASWSSEDACWTLSVRSGRKTSTIRCGFVIMCSGYYRYDRAYTPDFPGIDKFSGTVIHPQFWPEDLDYAGKSVVVIGSGATAMTLVPAMSRDAGHVTMLQRSPTYVVSMPDQDPVAGLLGKYLDKDTTFRLARWKNVLSHMFFYELSRRQPDLVKRLIRAGLRQQLGPDFDIDRHFTPSYNPWDQRVCLVPNADLFRAIRRGDISVVTDHIERFTKTGIRLRSGELLKADIVITATGLELLPAGGVTLNVDGTARKIADSMSYRGVMLSELPNCANVLGYTNASWTLKADLSCGYICELLNHMDRKGYDVVTPVNDDPEITDVPLLNLDAGYIRRHQDQFPRQGSRKPWKLYQNYLMDLVSLKRNRFDDGALRFSRRPGQRSRQHLRVVG